VTAASPDPFPRDRFTALLGRLPRYARLAWRLARSDRLSRSRRAVLLAGAAYLASPIDLVPGLIPVAGQLDDAAAVLFALKVALGGLPSAERRETLAAAGLAEEDLAADLRSIGATYAWLGRRGGRLAWRGTRAAARATGRLGVRFFARARR
jgi:uncharacterized membrane protein YkvA (DUF1232 family)